MSRSHLPRSRNGGLRIAVLAHLHHPIASPYAGGLEAHTAQVVAALTDRGHDVILFAKAGTRVACRHVAVLEGRFTVEGYPDSRAMDRQHGVLDGAMRTAIRSARRGFDVVLNNSLSPVPYTALLGFPTLNVFHTPPLPRIVAVLSGEGWTPDPRHAYVSVSESNARAWRQHLPSLGVIHNGIPLHQWDPTAPRRAGQAVWTGRITPEKGTHVAIAAARRAGVELTLAGPIHDPEYFSLMIEPELDASIRYAGHLDHPSLRTLLSGAEVLVASPLWEEPFGLNVVEALASGTPVAALPAGAMTEIISPAAGVVASRADAEALAEAITAARRLPHGAVALAAQRFSIEHMVERYEAELLRLAGGVPVAGTRPGRGAAAAEAHDAEPAESDPADLERADESAGDPAAGH
ncbi:glycosyltransferase family 4 protein [Arthrobacter ginkgonis]|uniref:Glycosyltransferase family 4 protein n=1 Tax=Arthrobacter ginkgonis TaxID=1630594 RepID=A0ABP7CF02_9MICC